MKLFPQHSDTQDQALQTLVMVGDSLADSLPRDRLSSLIGRLEEIKARAFARLAAPAAAASESDRAIGHKEAAELLGVSVRTLYNTHKKLPYSALKCPRAGRKLLFSTAKIAQFLKQKSID
jgi:hypothetical protein